MTEQKTPIAHLCVGLSDAKRVQLVELIRAAGISDNDPVLAVLAGVRVLLEDRERRGEDLLVAVERVQALSLRNSLIVVGLAAAVGFLAGAIIL
jgi:hypothetical protein